MKFDMCVKNIKKKNEIQKIFKRIKFSYKIGCNFRLQHFLLSFYYR